MTARRLQPVPDQPRRLLALIRVSKGKEGGISPEVQRTTALDYAAKTGAEIVGWVEGVDESGSQQRSNWWRKLDDAVAAVEAGEYDGIVVWKFSRTARHRLRWAVALDRVESAGGTLESATEQFDVATSAGRFARGMTAEMNAFYAEMIGESWKEAHEQRVRSGRPHSGRARWGYVYDQDEKIHKPHPEQGPVLADLYRRYIAGESIWSLVQWLNGHGWRGNRGTPFSDNTLRKILDSGFAAGKFYAGGDPKRGVKPTLHDGIHEPLITPEEWQDYLDARSARRKVPPRREGSRYLLSGLVRCARCGSVMVAYREEPKLKRDPRRAKAYSSAGVRLSWRCKRCPELGKGPSGYVASWRVEDVVMDFVRDLAADVDELAKDAAVTQSRRTLQQIEVDRLAREAVKLEEAMVRLATSNAENPLPPAVYAASKGELEERAAKVAAALEAVAVDERRALVDRAAEAARLLEQWSKLPVAGRREILRGLLDCVLVRTGPEPFIDVVPWERARG